MYFTHADAPLRPDLFGSVPTDAELAETRRTRELQRRQTELLAGIIEDAKAGNAHGVIVQAGLLHAIRERILSPGHPSLRAA